MYSYIAKQAHVFTKPEFDLFLLSDWPGEINVIIRDKAIFVCGWFGCCRICELTAMACIDFAHKLDGSYDFGIPIRKNISSNKKYRIPNSKGVILADGSFKSYASFLTDYINLLYRDNLFHGKLFKSFSTRYPTYSHFNKKSCGRNVIGNIPRKLARMMKLANPEAYSGLFF